MLCRLSCTLLKTFVYKITRPRCRSPGYLTGIWSVKSRQVTDFFGQQTWSVNLWHMRIFFCLIADKSADFSCLPVRIVEYKPDQPTVSPVCLPIFALLRFILIYILLLMNWIVENVIKTLRERERERFNMTDYNECCPKWTQPFGQLTAHG